VFREIDNKKYIKEKAVLEIVWEMKSHLQKAKRTLFKITDQIPSN